MSNRFFEEVKTDLTILIRRMAILMKKARLH